VEIQAVLKLEGRDVEKLLSALLSHPWT
jgi:hypothetical protein